MQTDTILQADVLDIIFENRNKDYGAYALRKYYSERLYKALGGTFLLIGICVLIGFIPGKQKTPLELTPDYILTTAPISLPHKPAELKMLEKPKEATVQQKVNTTVFVNKIVFTNASNIPKISTLTDSTVISNKTETGANPGATVLVKGSESPGGNATVETKTIDKEKPLLTAEIMPAYPGGMDALRKFLQKNLRNPQDLDDGQTISVKIKFIVGYDGALKGFETVEDGGSAFNNEVIRVLKKMPGWIPGRSNGENVSVYYTIPVKFVSE